MQQPDTSDYRLTNLEIKVCYQEDLLDQLNRIIVRQQQEIDLVMREVRRLRQQVPEGAGQTFSRASEELPPHY